MTNQFIGQGIIRVTYFEINDPDQPFFFTGFDNFDLGIEIEFSNGLHWHIGWKENDRPEVGIGKYAPKDYFNAHKQIDATDKWSRYLGAEIQDFEIIWVNEAWNLPAKCTINFANSEAVSIIIAEELNLDGSLPLPLKYSDNCEMYVFHGKELPAMELVEIIVDPEFYAAFSEEDDLSKPVKPKLTMAVFLVFVFLVIVAVVVYREWF